MKKIDIFWCWFVVAFIASFCLILAPLFFGKKGAIQPDSPALLTSTKYSIEGIRLRRRFGILSVSLGVMSLLIGIFCGVHIVVSLVFGASIALAALPNFLYGSLKEVYFEDGRLRISNSYQEGFVSFEDIKRAHICSPKGRPGEVVLVKLKTTNLFGSSFSLVPANMPKFYLFLQKHGIELEGYKYHEGYYRSHSEL